MRNNRLHFISKDFVDRHSAISPRQSACCRELEKTKNEHHHDGYSYGAREKLLSKMSSESSNGSNSKKERAPQEQGQGTVKAVLSGEKKLMKKSRRSQR
jgi:hypothetical protein